MGNCLILMKNYDKPRTETYAVTSKSSSIDMGEYNNFRYINSSGVPNVNSSTYTPTSRSASLDMGVDNAYRYVNTNSVPNSNSDTYPATSKGASLDMGATNTYRYVNTNGVPVSISNLYTYSAQGDTSFSYKLTASYKYVLIIASIGDGGGDAASISISVSGKTLTDLFNKRLNTRDYDNYTRVCYFTNGESGNTVTVNGKWCRHVSILGLN